MEFGEWTWKYEPCERPRKEDRVRQTQRERESLGRNYVQFNVEGQKIKMKVWKGKSGSFYI